MITVDKVVDNHKSDAPILGVEIVINEKYFFISIDQKTWPEIRLGQFPNNNNGQAFLRESLFSIQTPLA